MLRRGSDEYGYLVKNKKCQTVCHCPARESVYRRRGDSHMIATARAREPIGKTLSVEDRVRQRAYELYVNRGCESGSELDDWLQAEQDVLLAQDEQRDDD